MPVNGIMNSREDGSGIAYLMKQVQLWHGLKLEEQCANQIQGGLDSRKEGKGDFRGEM